MNLSAAAGLVHEGRVIEARDFSDKERSKLAKKGEALPDGSFPIKNVSDLENALRSIGRAKDYAAARRHIIKRAKALKATKKLPPDWKVASK